MPGIADRNLLWGVLALQMEFITRDALVGAMTAWTTAKDRDLEDILIERGDLDPLDRDAIRPMFARHLARHGGDPGKSLAALSSIGPAREVVERVDDPDLRSSLGHVGVDATALHGADTRATATYHATPYAPGSIRYRRLRPHARGNLGEVFVAHDDELHREVALKEIQEKHADRDDSRRRFLVEAEITGGLEHPGIVPVYGLGQYPDGRPFYAMRFIKGDSLKEAIATYHKSDHATADPGERSLALRKLLRRFTDVCNAIAYAHSRGILHRDLKPGNIMVGKYGETLVVDWGLAKSTADRRPDADESVLMPSSGSGLAETVDGSVIGTPAYMPPEQAAGRINELGPRSDVYSLGATLYHLLTGRAPFERGEFADVLRRVERGDFPRPRSVVPSVPKGLEAICLKAMATRPDSRYPSALALAADIDHWLADEPIEALPDRPLDRLARWSRHHRAATMATAGTLLSITLAATTAALLIAEARRGTEQALADRTQALTAQRLATEEKSNALAAETRAREQMRVVFDKARRTVADLVMLIRDDSGLRQTPALRPFRQAFLGRALAFSRGVLKDYEAIPGLRVEVADTYLQLGYLNQETGRPIDAESAWKKSLATYEALVAEQPENDAYRDGLASACINLGNLQQETGRPSEAERSYQRAREQFDRLVANRPENPSHREGLAMSLNNLGVLQSETGRPDEAERSYNRARELRERLHAEQPGSHAYREGLAMTWGNLGGLQARTGRPAEAERTYQRAREQFDRLVIEQPGRDAYRAGLAKTWSKLGNLQIVMGRLADAERSYNQARELYQRLVAERPESGDYRAGLAGTWNNLGNLQQTNGRPAEAERSYNRARELREKLVADRPESDDDRDGLARLCNNLGYLQRALGRPSEAERNFNRARELGERLVTNRPESDNYREVLAATFVNLGVLQQTNGRPAEAERSYNRARELREKLVAERPESDNYRDGLAQTWNNLGYLQQSTRRPAEARRSFGQGRALYERLVAERPEVPEYRNGLGHSLLGLGGLAAVQASDRELDESRQMFLAAIVHHRAALNTNPRDPTYRSSLSTSYFGLAYVERLLGHQAEAIAATSQRRRLWPGNPLQLYNAACDFALCAPLAPAGSTDRTRSADLAIGTLSEAVAAGWTDFRHTANDPDLIPLRDRDDFRALLTQMMDRAFPADPFMRP